MGRGVQLKTVRFDSSAASTNLPANFVELAQGVARALYVPRQYKGAAGAWGALSLHVPVARRARREGVSRMLVRWSRLASEFTPCALNME